MEVQHPSVRDARPDDLGAVFAIYNHEVLRRILDVELLDLHLDGG